MEARSELNLSASERQLLYKDERRSQKISAALPEGCELAVSPSVSPNTIEIGRKIVEATEKIGVDSVNMNFYGTIQLLDILLPWNAYNILTRKGMTRIIDKFWFSYVGLLHVTNKLNYQENMLMYSIVRSVMPEAARFVLYEVGQYVMNLHETATNTNIGQDDGVESKIIRDTKNLKTNNRKTVESSPPFTMGLGHARSAVEKELNPVVKHRFIEDEMQQSVGPANRDREQKTSLNVLRILEFLRERKWLGEEHKRRPEVVNVLRDPWLVVADVSFREQYFAAEDTGRLAASLHLGAKFYNFFPALTEEELNNHFGGKSLKVVQDKWTLKWVLKTMRDLDPASTQICGGKRKRGAKDRVQLRMTKRLKQLFRVKGALNKIISDTRNNSKERVEAACMALAEVERNDHVLSSKAYAYRSGTSLDEPYRNRDEFISGLQAILSDKGFLRETGTFLRRDSLSWSVRIRSIHLDITGEVRLSPSLRMQRTTIGEAVYDKVEKFVSPFVISTIYKRVSDFHYHVDAAEFLPRQHPMGRKENGLDHEMGMNLDTEDEHLYCGDNGDQSSPFCETDNPMKLTWRSIISNMRNFEFLKSLHAVLAAKATILLRKRVLTDGDCGVSGREECTAFLHGVSIAITPEGRASSLLELDFLRMEDSVLVTRKPKRPRAFFKFDSISEGFSGIETYGAECCWKVTCLGFERYPAGDSFHGESQTRVIHSIEQISIPRFSNARLSSSDCGVLILSRKPESPLITLLSKFHQYIFHQLEEYVVHVQKMREALEAAHMSAEDVVLLYALSGSPLTPHTCQISQRLYVEGYFCAKTYFHSLHSVAILSFPDTGISWRKFELIVATAYLLKYRSLRERQSLLVGGITHIIR